jgi:hypothetical protein
MKTIIMLASLTFLALVITGCGGSDTKAQLPTNPQKYDPTLKDGPPPPGREAASKREGEAGRGRPSN